MTSRAPVTAEGGAVALVVSPQAAVEDEIRPLRTLLEQAGLRVGEQLGVAEVAGDRRAGRRWRQARYRAVIAAGGDGTIGTTASHLVGTDIPLGILPMGTSNDVARALHIPFDLAAAAAAIAGGVPTQIDTGVVRASPGSVRDGGGALRQHMVLPPRLRALSLPWSRWFRDADESLCFLHAATLGLNVEFARLASDASRRAALGGLTYPAASIEALTHLQAIAVTLQLAGVPARDRETGQLLEGAENQWDLSITTEVLQLAVVNTPVFGGALHLSLPGVDAHDQLLDVFLVESPHLERGLDTVRVLIERLRAPRRWRKVPLQGQSVGKNEDQELADLAGDMVFPGIRRYQAHEVSIQTASPVQLTLDGEVRTQTPVQVRVERARVAVLLPVSAESA